MSTAITRQKLEQLATWAGRRLPAVEPSRQGYLLGASQLESIRDDFRSFEQMDQKTLNGHPDLDGRPGHVLHQYSPGHSMQSWRSPDGQEQVYLEQRDGQTVVAEWLVHQGDQWSRLSLLDHQGNLTAEIISATKARLCEEATKNGSFLAPDVVRFASLTSPHQRTKFERCVPRLISTTIFCKLPGAWPNRDVFRWGELCLSWPEKACNLPRPSPTTTCFPSFRVVPTTLQ